jgi:hypothetical protein
MAHSQTGFQGQIDRRTFLLAGVAVATGAAAEAPRLETADHGQDARVLRTAVRLQHVLSDGPNVSVFGEAAETI